VNLLVIRHAAAEKRKDDPEASQDESTRPLAPKGRKRMERAARGLKALLPGLTALATSPATRAVQTAEIIAAAYGEVVPLHLDSLAAGGDRRAVLSWIQMQRDDATVAVVGHEPDLSVMISWLLSSPDRSFVRLKRGGACLLTWRTHVTAGDADLVWLLTNAQLRKFAKKRGEPKQTGSPTAGVEGDDQQ
jgi:phosphohistidine phosphatase